MTKRKKKAPKAVTIPRVAKTKVLKFTVDPDRSFLDMASTLMAPKGYHFESMERHGNEASITYRRIGG